MNLDGVRVIDFSHLLPGPYATQLLADMGATVAKVEPPGGEAARHMEVGGRRGALFEAVNHGKRSLELDLNRDADREAVYELVETADVVVEQFRPGVTDRLGIDYDALTEYNPDLVYCSISGYGQTGPARDRVGHDLNIAAATGLVDLTRAEADGRPAIPGFPFADMASGAMATNAILGTLLERELGNGSGRRIDVSMADALLSFSQILAAEALRDDDPRARETLLTGQFPCYDLYETADGRYLSVAALEPPFWEALCEALDRPDLVDDHLSSDPSVREALRAELQSEFATEPLATWTDRLGPDTMTAPVRTMAEALEWPQTRERQMVLDDGDDPPRLGFPAKTRPEMPPEPRGTSALGEDLSEVLSSWGVTRETIERVEEGR